MYVSMYNSVFVSACRCAGFSPFSHGDDDDDDDNDVILFVNKIAVVLYTLTQIMYVLYIHLAF